jgi:predicted  nucleic acid-binding Zn-ribbon protein
MKKRITAMMAATLAVCSFSELRSQQAMGLFAGNHNAPYSAFQNPANTFSDRNRVYINFWGGQVGFTNNSLTWNAPFGLIPMANGEYPEEYTDPSGNLIFDGQWLPWKGTPTEKLYYLNEIYGPSVTFRTSRRTALGFGLRGISGISMDGVGQDLGRLLRYGFTSGGPAFNDNGLKLNTSYTNDAFAINADRYQEWYISLAGVTRDRGPHFVKWGGTGKFLLGMGAAGLNADGVDFSSSSTELAISNSNMSFYHTNGTTANRVVSSPLGLKFNEVQGLGAGMDLGFVYQYRPDNLRKRVTDWWNCADELRNDYAWKFGASVTDLGFIAYDGSRKDLTTPIVREWYVSGGITNVLSQIGNNQGMFQRIDTGFFDDPGIAAESNNRFVTTTPAALNLQFDVNLKNNFYLGLNLQQNLKKVNSFGIKKTSYFSAIPRWEKESVEIGIPITLTQDYDKLNVGLYGRLGPVIVGTDNLAGLASFVANNNYQAANVYFAVRLQLAACGWSRYNYYPPDTTIRDSVFQTDTVNFWESDTLTKTDTIYKEKIIRDTVTIQKRDTIIEYRNSDVSIDPTREDALRKKEAALKLKEEELKRREAAVIIKENDNTEMSATNDCRRRIAELEEQLKRERELYVKLNNQNQDTKEERDRAKLRIAELERDLAKAKADYQVLVNENTGLKLEIDRLKAEIIRLKASDRPATAQVKTLDSLLALEQTRNIELQKENSKQKAEVTAVKKENEDRNKRIAELEAEIAKLKATCIDKAACDKAIKDLQDQLSAEKAKVAGLQKELDETKAKYNVSLDRIKVLEEQLKNCGNAEELARIKAELEAEKKKSAALDISVKALETENTELKNTNSTQKAKVTALEKELADTKAKLDAETKKVLDLTEQLKNCGDAEEKAKLQAEIDALKKANSDKDVKITSLEKELLDTKAKLAAESQKVITLTEQLKNCGDAEEKARLLAEIDALKKSNSEKDAQITGLRNDKAKLEGDLSTAKAKISDLESQLAECKSKDCSELEAQLAEYKGKYDEAKRSLESMTAEYNALVTANNQLKAKLADCEEKLKNCSSSSEEISKLEAEIKDLKLAIGTLKGEVASKEKSLEDLRESYDLLKGEKTTLEKQVGTLQAEITTLNAKVADLEAKLKACQEGK